MRDLHHQTKAAKVLDRASHFVIAHPWRTAVYIIAFEVVALAALAHFTGCAPRPPVHFENGDRTI